MRVRDLKSVLSSDEYAVLCSIAGFEKISSDTEVAGLTKNGNYHILYFWDGTKFRFGTGDSLTPEFPECIDMTITKRCDGGCDFCYMNCSRDGKHADLNQPIMDEIHPFTELAINLNDMSHPDLESFLRKMKEKNVFVNGTIRDRHFVEHFDELQRMQRNGLINGIGISIDFKSDVTDTEVDDRFLINVFRLASRLSGVIYHVIEGITKSEHIMNIMEHGPVLILGYKDIGRGVKHMCTYGSSIEYNMKTLELDLKIAYAAGKLNGIAFDGLAIQDLHVSDWIPKDKFKEMYAGNEGAYTMYIDAVDKVYSQSSINSSYYEYFNENNDPQYMSLEEMFKRTTNGVEVLHN